MIKLKSKVFRLKINEKFKCMIKRINKFIENKYNDGFNISYQYISEKICIVTYWRED